MKKRRLNLKIAFIFLILISGCQSIDKQEAEDIALSFVKSNVKFFAKEGESQIDLPLYNIEEINSIKINNDWHVNIRISSDVDNETKKNDLQLTINNKGEIIELNGKKLPEPIKIS